MPRPAIKLIGHYNPFSEYPNCVVPICLDSEGERIAVYLEKSELQVRKLPEASQVVLHDNETIASIGYYNPAEHQLFAFSEKQVKALQRHEASRIFLGFLKGALIGANPFTRLSLAQMASDTSDIDTVAGAMRGCLLETRVVWRQESFCVRVVRPTAR